MKTVWVIKAIIDYKIKHFKFKDELGIKTRILDFLNPHTNKYKKKIGIVQQRTARYSYEELPQHLCQYNDRH